MVSNGPPVRRVALAAVYLALSGVLSACWIESVANPPQPVFD
jgi:hypothetical protein